LETGRYRYLVGETVRYQVLNHTLSRLEHGFCAPRLERWKKGAWRRVPRESGICILLARAVWPWRPSNLRVVLSAPLNPGVYRLRQPASLGTGRTRREIALASNNFEVQPGPLRLHAAWMRDAHGDRIAVRIENPSRRPVAVRLDTARLELRGPLSLTRLPLTRQSHREDHTGIIAPGKSLIAEYLPTKRTTSRPARVRIRARVADRPFWAWSNRFVLPPKSHPPR
jgi:hypothetical protein